MKKKFSSWPRATTAIVKCSFLTCSNDLTIFYTVCFFLTKDLKNMEEIKTKNLKIIQKLRKRCHRMVGYSHGNKIQILFCKVFSKSILPVKYLIAINF